MSYQGTCVTHIVAIDNHRCIGKNGTMPWHVSSDLQHFKRLTEYGIIIMGRTTFESLPAPLPNRHHWVLSTDIDYRIDMDNVYVAHNLDDALTQACAQVRHLGLDTVWIIGGEQVFEQTMHLTDAIELTQLDIKVEDGDTYYPTIPTGFEQVSTIDTQATETVGQDEKSDIHYRFVRYQREQA